MIERNFKARFLLLLIIIFIGSTVISQKKYNPGHYVAVTPDIEISEIKYLNEPSVKGVQKRYHWRILEPEKGKYDFSQIKHDLDFLARNGKQLIVFIIDVSYWKRSALPNYLAEYDSYSENEGWCPIRWHPEVIERFIALGEALGDFFDNHPNFEGVATQETSMGISKEGYEKFNYSHEVYVKALIETLRGLSKGIPKSNVFWYQNFLGDFDDGSRYLRQIADSIIDTGIILGGPDILPYRKGIKNISYPMYSDYKDKYTLFCSVQDCSYKHHKNDTVLHMIEPVHEEGYLTMEEIFKYGRDSLHLNYIIWNYYYDGEDKGHRSFDDAIEVIKKYPKFNFKE